MCTVEFGDGESDYVTGDPTEFSISTDATMRASVTKECELLFNVFSSDAFNLVVNGKAVDTNKGHTISLPATVVVDTALDFVTLTFKESVFKRTVSVDADGEACI